MTLMLLVDIDKGSPELFSFVENTEFFFCKVNFCTSVLAGLHVLRAATPWVIRID